jgi:hypothetical protein
MTWPQCERLLALVYGLRADIPITLLVVPHMHRGTSVDESMECRRLVDRVLARGGELALHGLWHLDEGGASPSLRVAIERRALSAGEAEFAAIDRTDARRRIETGLTVLRRCDWEPRGFVPPAWQMSAEAAAVLPEFPFEYTTSLGSMTRLPTQQRWSVPCLGFSARSALRRGLSVRWVRWRLAQLHEAPELRIALHPLDVCNRSTLAAWREVLQMVLRDRHPVTKSELCRAVASRAAMSQQVPSHAARSRPDEAAV